MFYGCRQLKGMLNKIFHILIDIFIIEKVFYLCLILFYIKIKINTIQS